MAHRIIPRSEWGARHPDGFYDRPVGRLERWLHHSVTIAPDLLPPFTDDYAAVRELEAIGQSRFKGGISYTFAVTPAGLVFQGHSIDRVGSHTQGHNTAGVGIVLIGNYEGTAPTSEQLAAITWLLHHGVEQGWWTSPTLSGGHRDTKGTACPGQKAYDQIPAINRGEYRTVTTGGFMADLTEQEKKDFLKNVAETRKLVGEIRTITGQNRTKITDLAEDEATRHLADLDRHKALAKVVEALDLDIDEADLRAKLRAAIDGVEIDITTKET